MNVRFFSLVLSFNLSTSSLLFVAPWQIYNNTPAPRASLSNPKSRKKVDCSRRPDGLYRCPISGKSQGVAPGVFQLLVWVNPVQPAGDGWYLQRGPSNGIRGIEKDGEWAGLIQVGSIQYPPHENDVIEIAVTVVKTEEARQLASASFVAP